MAESRAALRKTGSEYDGGQRAAMGVGGKLLTKLERQAVTERIVLWFGFACFLLAVLHVAGTASYCPPRHPHSTQC
jgi:hypothetical protein